MIMFPGLVIFFFVVGNFGTVDATFEDRAKDALNTFNTDFDIDPDRKDCVGEAESKAATFSDKTVKYRAAVAIVNLFTQRNCKNSVGKAFYKNLNSKLSTTSPPYKRFADLLNEAIDLLSVDEGADRITVYRTQSDPFPSKGPYQPLQFLVTSADFYAAHSMSTDGCFVKIWNAKGLHLNPFSATPSNDDVLIKNTAKFSVEVKYACQEGIPFVLNSFEPSLNASHDVSDITSVVEMTQKEDSWNMTSVPVENNPIWCFEETSGTSSTQRQEYYRITIAAMPLLLWCTLFVE